MRAERQQVRQVADRRERGLPEQLDRVRAPELVQVELDVLGVARQVRDDQHLAALVPAQEREDAVVVGRQELDRAVREHGIAA